MLSLSRQEPWFANFLLTEARGYRSRAIRIVEGGKWPVGTLFDRAGNVLTAATIADASFITLIPVFNGGGPAEALVIQRDSEVNDGYLLYGPLNEEEVNHYLLVNSNIIVRRGVEGGLLQTIQARDVWINPAIAGYADGQTMFEHLEADKLDRRGDTMLGQLLLTFEPTDPFHAATKNYVDQAVTGVAHYIGALDASQDLVRYTPASGIQPPLQRLVPADSVPEGSYVICEVPGTMPDDSEMPGEEFLLSDWAISDGTVWSHLGTGGSAITARNVAVSPPVFGADNVQLSLEGAEAALAALDTAKVDRAGDTMTGPLVIDAPGAEGLVVRGNPAAPAARIQGDVEVNEGILNVTDATGFIMSREAYFLAEDTTERGYYLGPQRSDGGLVATNGTIALRQRTATRPAVEDTVGARHEIIDRRGGQLDGDLTFFKPGGATGVTPAMTWLDGAGLMARIQAERTADGPALLFRIENGQGLGGDTLMRSRPGTGGAPSWLEVMADPVGPRDVVNKAYIDHYITGQPILIGALDANQDLVLYTPSSGITPNPGPLVPAGVAGAGRYVICAIRGTMPPGSVTPGLIVEAGDWLISQETSWQLLRVGAQPLLASNVQLLPNVFGAANVQIGMQNAETQVAVRIARTGDGMTGPLSVLMPTADLHAATRLYVDQAANAKVARAGDSMTGGLGFGSVAQASATDLTRHIALWGGATPTALGFGFSITSGTLNYCVSATANMHDFYAGATHIARLNNTEFAMQGARDVRARSFLSNADNSGFATANGGWFYKATNPRGMVIRCATGNIQPEIENTDGTNRRIILDGDNGVRKAGDVMQGTLGVVMPTAPTHAVPRSYVDSALAGLAQRWTTGAAYAVGQLVIWDNMAFQVLVPIPAAPATPNFTTLRIADVSQGDYWKGAPAGANWVAGNWVQLLTVPAYGTYRLQIDGFGAQIDNSLILDITTSFNAGSMAITSYARNPAAGPMWRAFRLSATAGGNPVRLEAQINIATSPDFKIFCFGFARQDNDNGVTIPKPLTAQGGGANLGGTQYQLLEVPSIGTLSTVRALFGDVTSSNGGYYHFAHANAVGDGNDGKIGARLFSKGLNLVGSATEAGDTTRYISVYGQVEHQQAIPGVGANSKDAFVVTQDGHGLTLNSGGRFYKATGAGMMIRLHTANTPLQIENNDGSNRRNVLDANETTRVRKAGDEMSGALTITAGGLQINAGNFRQRSTSNGVDGGQVHSWQDATGRTTGEIRVSQNGSVTGDNHQGSFELRVNTGAGIQRVAYTRYGAAPRLALDNDPINPEDVATRRFVEAQSGGGGLESRLLGLTGGTQYIFGELANHQALDLRFTSSGPTRNHVVHVMILVTDGAGAIHVLSNDWLGTKTFSRMEVSVLASGGNVVRVTSAGSVGVTLNRIGLNLVTGAGPGGILGNTSSGGGFFVAADL